MMRGLKCQSFWVMEQLNGGKGCCAPMEKPPLPGTIKGYALQAFDNGADRVVHFRWRMANIGAELHWHGPIGHLNVPGRRFHEFADLCKIAAELESLQSAAIKADRAILFSFDSEYSFKIRHQTEGYYYLEQLQRLQRALTGLGLNVDIIGQHEQLDGLPHCVRTGNVWSGCRRGRAATWLCTAGRNGHPDHPQLLYDHIALMAAENIDLPPHVEIVTRTGQRVTARFIFNSDNQPKTFALDGQSIALAPSEMKVFVSLHIRIDMQEEPLYALSEPHHHRLLP